MTTPLNIPQKSGSWGSSDAFCLEGSSYASTHSRFSQGSLEGAQGRSRQVSISSADEGEGDVISTVEQQFNKTKVFFGLVKIDRSRFFSRTVRRRASVASQSQEFSSPLPTSKSHPLPARTVPTLATVYEKAPVGGHTQPRRVQSADAAIKTQGPKIS